MIESNSYVAGLEANVCPVECRVTEVLRGRTCVRKTCATGLELQAIAAVVLGGTSIAGGSGAIWRTVVGVFLLAIINNAFNIMNLDAYLRDVVTGSLIILAVITNTLTGKK